MTDRIHTLSRYFPFFLVLLSVAASGLLFAQTSDPSLQYQNTHKIVVLKDDAASLEAAGSLSPRQIFDYPDRTVLIVDDAQLNALPATVREKLTSHDDMNQIHFRSRTIDTTQPLESVPQLLRAVPSETAQLHLIQFAGPVKEEWLEQVRAQGQVEIVTYIANNAYLIWTDGHTIERISTFALSNPFLQWMGPFHLIDRLHPVLQDEAEEDPVKVTVQFVAHEGVADSVEAVKTKATEVIRDAWTVGPYRNLRILVSPGELIEIAALPDVVNVEPYQDPQPGGERQGQIVADQLVAAGDQPTGPGYLAWLNALGFNTTFDFVADVADTGLDRGQITAANLHQDFLDGAGNSRVAYVQQVTGAVIDTTAANNNDPNGHGTLDLAIVGGFNNTADIPGGGTDFEDAAGYQYGLGIAPFVQLGSSRIFAPGWSNPDFTEMINAAYNNGARITSNSWGVNPGNGDYDATSQEYDGLVRDAQPATAADGGAPGNQEFVVVFLAGNSGAGASTLWDMGATAKNTLVVGASENFNQAGAVGCGTNASADDARDVISFSSRGPTTDGRIKPDIMAPGTRIFGAASQDPAYAAVNVCTLYFPAGQTLYTWSQGTSHSTPAVAGATALLRQWFLNQGRPAPSPAMTKAYLMNSPTYMTGAGANDNLYSNNQGMGRLNLRRSFDAIPRLLVDQTRTFDNAGDTYTISGTIADATEPFRVTLAWTDAPGPTVGNAWVNDLDLEVTLDDGTGPVLYRGNVFTNNVSQIGGAADRSNNVESVWLPAGTTGAFTVTVRGWGINGDGVPNHGDGTDQDFALVVYNGELPARAPVDIILVLDTSGSMGSVAPGGTDPKIQVLKDAAQLFVETWLPYSQPNDRIAVVFFDSAVTTFPATPPILQLFQSNAQAVIDAIVAESAGGWTAMGGGLQTAINTLNGTPNNPFILLFTNGMQNFSPMVGSLTGGGYDIRDAATGSSVDGTIVRGDSGIAGAAGTALSGYGITIHTIGTGVSGAQWEDLLAGIAADTGGVHHFATSPDAQLELYFLEDLVASLQGATLEMVAYRFGEFADGAGAKTERLPINASVKRASFLVSWRNKRQRDALRFHLVSPNGTVIDIPSHGQAFEQRGEFFTLATLSFPFRGRSGIVFPGGEWQIVVEEQFEGGGSVPYRVALLVDDTDVKYHFEIPQMDFGVGEAILLTAGLTESGLPITNITRAEVVVSTPRNGLGTFLSKNVPTKQLTGFDADHFSTPVARKQLELFHDPDLAGEFKSLATVIALHDDGSSEHGDAQAGDGIFSNIFTNTRLPGSYGFEFFVEGSAPVSGPFARRQSMATTIRLKAFDPSKTKAILKDAGDGLIRAVVIPVDAYDNYLGPGYGHLISFSITDAQPRGELVDNLDGSYVQMFQAAPGRTPTITVELPGTIIDLGVEPPWPPWKILSVIVLILGLIFFLLWWFKRGQNP